MARIDILKTNFTGGEVSPDLFGRSDLTAYENGAARLRNVYIHPTGGITRRDGTAFVATARGPGRLLAFEFNTEQVYLLAFTDRHVEIYRDGTKIADITNTPWTAAQLPFMAWTQSADTLLVMHPDVAPRRITRTGKTRTSETWRISNWSFYQKDGVLHQPYHRFADDNITLTPSAQTGSITLTASASVFKPEHVGQRFRLDRKQVRITSRQSSRSARATVIEELESTDATTEWGEPAFSPARGWPVTATFHQGRLVIGGSRDLPNRLWMSKSSDLFNFDLGEGLDDEAIEFDLLADQVNAVRAVFSGRHLQVMTTGAEWMVTGDPLTPENVQITRQTRIGSPVDNWIPPQSIDGATLFVARNGREVREFLFTDIEQAYQAQDLNLLARHLVNQPVDQEFDPGRRILHIINRDGSIAALTTFRTEKVTGWSGISTQGRFLSAAALGGDAYVLVQRGAAVHIERFSREMAVDSGSSMQFDTPRRDWSGLEHLNGKTVKVLADGAIHRDMTVENGAVRIDAPARKVQIGLGFTHEIAPLPPAFSGAAGTRQGVTIRLIEATFRLRETPILRVDTGQGLEDIAFRRIGNNPRTAILDAPPPPFTGDKRIRALGWRRGGVEPLWRVESDTPLANTILSVNTEVKVSD